MSRTQVRPNHDNSILYLALLCLIYYFFACNTAEYFAKPHVSASSEGKTYIEFVDGDFSTVIGSDSPDATTEIANKYNINSVLHNGYKVIHDSDKWVVSGRICGVKSLSLGIPIGLNSAKEEDLAALPGIGETIAGRIVEYRRKNGGFTSVEELLNVNGVGEKKLSAVKELVSLN